MQSRILPLLVLIICLFGTTLAQEPPPRCQYGDELTPGSSEDQYRFALVDTLYRLPAGHEPDDLVPVSRAGLNDERLLRREAVLDLAEMIEAAAAAGHRYELQSAYRSFEYQQRVFAGWVETLGRERALATSARPGHSEHQLGTALDLRSAGGPAPWDLDDWAQTPEGAWLEANAWRFGFVMSYPAGSHELTCYSYEPWHYRWFGREVADSIHRSGLSPREWLWRELQAGRER